MEMEIACGVISSNSLLVKDMMKILKGFSTAECKWISATYDDALNNILRETPALVFIDLDCEWEKENAFFLYHELNLYLDRLPCFVAISKSKTYSYNVIKSGMNDYLLYPFHEFELRKCIMKFYKAQIHNETEKICIKSNTDYRFIEMKDLIYLKADNNTVDLFLAGGKAISAFKTLRFFEENLPSEYLRIHNSYIVNTNYITRIHFGKYSLMVKGFDKVIPFSKSYKKEVENLKDQLKNKLHLVA